jgi:nucleoside-diphosphate-sugar epimerase
MSRTQYSVAVLGGSGFVGSSIAKRLSDSYDVTVLDSTVLLDLSVADQNSAICERH